MKRKVMVCKMISLFLAIQKNDYQTVYEIITEKQKLLLNHAICSGFTPIHYAIHLNNEVAEMLFEKAQRAAILEKSRYRGSTFSNYDPISGLQAAFNHNMMEFIENHGLLPEDKIKKCKQPPNEKSHGYVLYECMYYK
ncbi:hypothetical protein M153_2640002514 [Pseudoloma neurophilia]|uniref:Ankyrin repeat protein n=1 Tax=Pseudoloma neurophilia TaxID=146866 RepID=A0A0R0LYL3_9MICR|nr:hypothetical protein M153_2640002514 [Pseudoloma neurophilia]